MTNLMRVIPPVTITPAKLTSSTAAEPHAPAAYNAGATYGIGAIVSVAADFAIYESIDSGNLGKPPATSPLWWRKIGPTEDAYNPLTTYALGATVSNDHRCYESRQAGNTGNALPILPIEENDWWIDLGPTNKFAAFDLDVNTQTVVSTPLVIVFAPGERINALFFGGMEADILNITATSVYGGGTVYSYTRDLRRRIATTPTEYYFKPFSRRPSDAVFNVPPVSDIIITVTLASNSGNVKLGSIVAGQFVDIGTIVENPSERASNFSPVTRNLYGKARIVRRRTVPSTEQKVLIEHVNLDKVRQLKVDLNGVVCAWVGIPNSDGALFDALAKIGFYENFDFDHSPNHSVLNLRIQEL